MPVALNLLGLAIIITILALAVSDQWRLWRRENEWRRRTPHGRSRH